MTKNSDEATKSTEPSGRRFTAGAALVLALAILVAHANSFRIGFVFDDEYGIQKNEAIRSLANIPSFFTDPTTISPLPQHADVRPILVTSFALNHAISGLEPWSYHALNLLLHFLAAFALFLIVRDHAWWPRESCGAGGDARWPAAACALLFALAPLNTQAVNYLWARSALLGTALLLVAFLAFQRKRWGIAGLFHGLALLTHSVALALPLLLIVHDALFRDRERHQGLRSWLGDWRRLARPIGMLLIIDGLYLALRWIMEPALQAAMAPPSGVTRWTWIMSSWSSMLTYARLFALPTGLSVDHDAALTTSLADPRAWVALLVMALCCVVAVLIARRHPVPAFATAWFVLTLSAESMIAPMVEIVSDHRPYLASSLGLSLLLTWIIWSLASRFSRSEPRRALIGATIALCLLALPVTWHRNWEWSDGVRLWRATTRISPNNTRAWQNLGRLLMDRGDHAEAQACFERSLEISPNYVYALANVSLLQLRQGQADESLKTAERAVALRPDLGLTHFRRARALAKLGRGGDAAEAYRKVLEIDPSDEDAKVALAAIPARVEAAAPTPTIESLMKEGLDARYRDKDAQRAIPSFRAVLALSPTHYGATYQLAAALDAAGQRDEAIGLWRTTLAMAETYQDAETTETARLRLAEGK